MKEYWPQLISAEPSVYCTCSVQDTFPNKNKGKQGDVSEHTCRPSPFSEIRPEEIDLNRKIQFVSLYYTVPMWPRRALQKELHNVHLTEAKHFILLSLLCVFVKHNIIDIVASAYFIDSFTDDLILKANKLDYKSLYELLSTDADKPT